MKYQIFEILARNKEADIYDHILCLLAKEDDSLVIIDWQQIGNLVEAIRVYVTQDAPHQLHPPFQLPDIINESSIKICILRYIRAAGAAEPIGTCILPCIGAEHCAVTAKAVSLSYDPWFTYLSTLRNICPLGHVFLSRPRGTAADRITFVPGHVPLWMY